MMIEEKRLFVGVLSGTSVDSIDVAVCEFDDELLSEDQKDKYDDRDPLRYRYEVNVVAYESVDWKESVKRDIFDAMNNDDLNAKFFCRLNRDIGEEIANAVNKVLVKYKIDKNRIKCVASHGQTIWHESDEITSIVHSTMQLGESCIIAERTGIDVVSDFRQMDVACGGNGAPLMSIFDACFMRPISSSKKEEDPVVYRALQNIGGIGNVSLLRDIDEKLDALEERPPFILSFDTGPGNGLIDETVRYFTNNKKQMDIDGELASKAKPNSEMLNELMSMPYVNLEPPKSTGKELFGKKLVMEFIEKYKHLSSEEIISTFTEFTAESICFSYEKFWIEKIKKLNNSINISLKDVVVFGGGSYNKELMKRIKQKIRERIGENVEVLLQDDVSMNIKSESKEAILFAFLGYLFNRNRYGNIKEATNAKKNVVLGKLTKA